MYKSKWLVAATICGAMLVGQHAHAFSATEARETANGMVGWAGIYQDQCGAVPQPLLRMIVNTLLPMTDKAEVMAAASRASDLIDEKGKDWWCGKVKAMYDSANAKLTH